MNNPVFQRAAVLSGVLLLLVSLSSLSLAQDAKKAAPDSRWQADFEVITKGLAKVTAPGSPGAVAAINDNAFVIVAGEESGTLVPVVAAGERPGPNRGRIVVLGHDGYLFRQALEVADTGKLVDRLARWAGKVPAGQGQGTLGVVGRFDVEPVFAAAGWQVKLISGDWTRSLDGVKTLLITAGDVTSPAQAEALKKYLNQGGGLVFGITGWGWEQVTGQSLTNDLVIGPLLAEAGLAVTNAFASPTVAGGFGVLPFVEAEKAHAGLALSRLGSTIREQSKWQPGEARQIGSALLMAARSTRADEPSFRRPLTSLLGQWPRREISAAKPVGQQDIQDRLAIQVDFELEKSRPASQIGANPSARIFPGPVDEKAPRISKKLTIQAGSRGRIATALYAPAGGVVELKPVGGAFPAGLQVRIGAHSDTTWHLDRWERHPEISRTWPLAAGTEPVKIASGFGGLIYLENGRPLADPLQVEISGAVETLHFQLGVTTPDEWQKLRESAAAPWAELVSRHAGLVLPLASVKNLDDPRPLLEQWDRVIEVQDQLGPLNPPYKPIQWVVPDQQISAGYMHSGNPIMTFLDVVPFFSRAERLLASEPGGVSWGILHEIGHNRQRGEWTPDGLGEVTNNLFALYVYDKMLGQPSSGHPGLLTGEKRAAALAAYRKTGPDFNRFKNDPFLALAFFMGVQEKYGWQPFINYFAEVEKLPRGSRPRTEQARWDAWLLGLSKHARKDLGPYFKEWGIPVSQQALEAAARLDASANP
ncbi:MAG: M60 family metallopeptidase [bacterium]